MKRKQGGTGRREKKAGAWGDYWLAQEKREQGKKESETASDENRKSIWLPAQRRQDIRDD